ncbi:DUF3489 domain-containing protein [Mesorhizobium australicum]|uniref:Uncharacterized protein n=1 Tax=Mesorhizobium australicum TaxID=536018 RepID=A0A1X7NYE5_9HYPH|nr:DUF3489 domain-containing protein [Mesorhizobium australicum]SMH43421.1 Protein of unknown function [Mesorhizobium australicum]
MTNTSNLYRKVRALVAKTVTNGCEPAEAISAANLASKLIAEHQLDAAKIDWPAAPEGYRWEGTPGVGGELVAEAPVPEKPKRTRTPKAEPKPKRPTRKERVAEMLRSQDGTTIEAIMSEFGVLAHSARAMVSVYGREIGGVTYDRENKVYRARA